MKRSGKCTKCGSAGVIRIPGQVGTYGSGNNIPAGWWLYSAVKVTRFLCGECGYSEEWVESPEDLEKLRAKYGR